MDLVLEELIAEAINGRISINEDYYNIGFNTNIIKDNQIITFSKDNSDLLFPTLQINDFNLFTYYLFDYVNKAKSFYQDELKMKYSFYSDKEIVKLLMSLVWANATSYDFNNPIEYLRKRIKFLDDDCLLDYFNSINTKEITTFDNSVIEYKISKSPLILEAPYILETRLKKYNSLNDGDIYQLPNIFFGIDGDTCYLYAIQNKRVNSNNKSDGLSKYQKNIRRSLNKVKKGFESDICLDAMSKDDIKSFNINYPENIISVDPSFLVSLTTCLAILNNKNIANIVVPDFFPVRYNSSQIITCMKSKLKSTLDKDQFLQEEELKNEMINRNTVDKKIRTFRRLAHHFSFLNIYMFPKECDDCCHISINNSYSCNNELLDEVYTKVFDSINKNKYNNNRR